ncbi:hypothetical protein HYH03_012378 [Edaphochlamys debaryana]|uniref:FIST domain-containing protein n=1 Tax=Edaphochlamys debaryana TaxID=47281 RepID=A0A835XQA9_9CHLO|nr:hypothetical protein HYH03_012378 [Edaphochlamys debaryana]|eukprot:KAG2489152.1 hypothetical protein HYH03_012378 [Edaphochlamys debaryana]
MDECIAQIRKAMRAAPGSGSGSGYGSGSDAAGPAEASSSSGADAPFAPELAIVFVTASFGPDFERLVPLLRERLPSLKHVFGCSAFGVMGGGKGGTTEADGEPALSLTLASLPGSDVRVFHTLRSAVPEEDAAVERWGQFVGVPADTPRHVSFLLFADPRFSQLYTILEGLDYSFPRAAKLGGMLSVGVRSRQRAMFAWSAPEGQAQGQGQGQGERKGRGGAAETGAGLSAASVGSDDSDSGLSGQSGSSNGNGGGGWLQRSLGAVLDKLMGGQGGQGGGGGAGDGGGVFQAFNFGGDAGGDADATSSMDEDPGAGNGLYMYGAVCLVLHGDVKLDTIVSQGFRAPSPTVWRVEATAAGMGSGAPAGHILGISDASEAPPTALPPPPTPPPALPAPGSAPTAGPGAPTAPGSATPAAGAAAGGAVGGAAASAKDSGFTFPPSMARGFGGPGARGFGGGLGRARGLGPGGPGAADDSDDDSDDEDGEGDSDDELAMSLGGLGVDGTPALAAIIDVVEALGSESSSWEDVMETCVVAVAADTTKPLEDLGPADWEIMELKGVDQTYGTMIVEGEVRRGYRIKIMIRDPPGLSEDLAAQLLAYKREDLRRLLAGSPPPPAFGALVFTDVERTPTSSGAEVTESSVISSYLPLPTGGMFGGAQIAPLPGATELVEYSSVIGVLRATRALPPAPPVEGQEDGGVMLERARGGAGAGAGAEGGAREGGEEGGAAGGVMRRRKKGPDGGKDGAGRGGRGSGRRSGGGGGGGSRPHRGRSS